ncbi:MAG: hypothetical protein NWF08_01835 [Candidatus Bathyarchaeota archaeon]|nr:hypothetical protein [Candidatus Bathyarchaeota archaeon]
MKSWKIGAISGLVAGFITGLVTFVFTNIGNIIGLPIPWAITFPQITDIATIHIILGMIWGTILGIIYSKVHVLIQGKSTSKGLIFSMVIFLIFNIRQASATAAYGFTLYAVSYIFIGIPMWISFGLVLGVLYKYLLNMYYPTQKKLKIIGYDLKGGIQPGAIAGAIGGIVYFICMIPIDRWVWGTIALELSFLVAQMGSHILYNMAWGAVFGAIFARVYNIVPGKGAMKGLYYALVVFLITSFHISTYNAAYALYTMAIASSFGIFRAITEGLVLGYLYKK